MTQFIVFLTGISKEKRKHFDATSSVLLSDSKFAFFFVFAFLPGYLMKMWKVFHEKLFEKKEEENFMVFSFLPQNVHFISKNAISCLFLKNVSPSKYRAICFILNNLHFPMVEGIAFYAPHKSRVLIISCKADGFCLFIGLPDEI